MNIQKATIKALKKRKGITRKKYLDHGIFFAVTQELSMCLDIVCQADLVENKPQGMHVGKYWNPAVEDLIATDWVVR